MYRGWVKPLSNIVVTHYSPSTPLVTVIAVEHHVEVCHGYIATIGSDPTARSFSSSVNNSSNKTSKGTRKKG
jgi:hypothetical protein